MHDLDARGLTLQPGSSHASTDKGEGKGGQPDVGVEAWSTLSPLARVDEPGRWARRLRVSGQRGVRLAVSPVGNRAPGGARRRISRGDTTWPSVPPRSHCRHRPLLLWCDTPRQRFLDALPIIGSVIRDLGRRYHLSRDEREEFAGNVNRAAHGWRLRRPASVPGTQQPVHLPADRDHPAVPGCAREGVGPMASLGRCRAPRPDRGGVGTAARASAHPSRPSHRDAAVARRDPRRGETARPCRSAATPCLQTPARGRHRTRARGRQRSVARTGARRRTGR